MTRKSAPSARQYENCEPRTPDMPTEHFKSKTAYRKWNAYRHIHGIPAPGLKTAVVAGKAHTVHHSDLSKPGIEKFRGESHSYDFKRPKRKVVSRYV